MPSFILISHRHPTGNLKYILNAATMLLLYLQKKLLLEKKKTHIPFQNQLLDTAAGS
jgi:hypothetical protein